MVTVTNPDISDAISMDAATAGYFTVEDGQTPMDQLTEEQKTTVQETADRLINDRKVKRMGSVVFCVACGARHRTLYKWHNSYICQDCRKILMNVGEEQFMKALRGEEDSPSDTIERN